MLRLVTLAWPRKCHCSQKERVLLKFEACGTAGYVSGPRVSEGRNGSQTGCLQLWSGKKNDIFCQMPPTFVSVCANALLDSSGNIQWAACV